MFLPAIAFLAYYLDKVRIWPLMLVTTLMQMTFLTLFYFTASSLVNANLSAGDRGNVTENISFTMIQYITQISFPLNVTVLSKALKKSDISFGISQAGFWICSSSAALIIDYAGGTLY